MYLPGTTQKCSTSSHLQAILTVGYCNSGRMLLLDMQVQHVGLTNTGQDRDTNISTRIGTHSPHATKPC